ncbi:MAG TPA: hypothetical protein VLL54_12885 [Pyrinomonadaceae bacterium]|nr:hypothetical protein [Pyrinomonadaceae bacterium]
MSERYQLVAFIDPEKFGRLVGEKTIPDYLTDETSGNYLNNSKSIVYVYNDRLPAVEKFKASEAGKTSVLLVSDGCAQDAFPYVPKRPFKVLFHSSRDSADKIENLQKSNFFRGNLESSEHPSTLYGTLANAIRLKSLDSDLPKVLEQIPLIDPALEASLKLLWTVLNREKPKGDLLESLKQYLPKQSLSKVVKDLKDLEKIGSDIFSHEYQTAFGKLRDSLKIQSGSLG